MAIVAPSNGDRRRFRARMRDLLSESRHRRPPVHDRQERCVRVTIVTAAGDAADELALATCVQNSPRSPVVLAASIRHEELLRADRVHGP
ncbi:MAG TPA: hypothetical protein ENJ18_19590 [Nannocystis exedens]|nr:hypothetical protein [Nannocystis exedens]